MEELKVRVPNIDRPDQWMKGYLDSFSINRYISKVDIQAGASGLLMVVTYFNKLEN